jgi:hypothetical protein
LFLTPVFYVTLRLLATRTSKPQSPKEPEIAGNQPSPAE